MNGDTICSDDLSGLGAREVPSWYNKLAGFAGIFGFSARLAGGGSEALFVFLSNGLWNPCPKELDTGDRRPGWCAPGTEDAKFGEVGR